MIQSFTYNGAYANFLEGETGSIDLGKQADIVVLDQNLYDIAPQRKSLKQKSCSLYLLERRFLETQSSSDKTIIRFFVRCVLL
jgi:cytosine/adenosine deaminase-related metal-dependent hydrolase